MSTGRKVALFLVGYALLLIAVGLIFGSDGKNDEFQPQNEFQLDSWVTLPGPLEIVSDSTYVVNCFKQRWHATWRANGWRNSQKKPVANRDLWEPLIEQALARNVLFRWVKGHGTDRMNALVDELAVLAAQTQAGQRGQRPGGFGS